MTLGGDLLTVATGGTPCPSVTRDISALPQFRGDSALGKRGRHQDSNLRSRLRGPAPVAARREQPGTWWQLSGWLPNTAEVPPCAVRVPSLSMAPP